MPLCVHCAYPAQHLYTTYKTKSNIRLAVCPRCDRFLDPLIEHDPLILLLDLVLLKPRVFLHLLFNRGTPPLDALAPSATSIDRGRDDRLRVDVTRLALLVVGAETIVRLIPHTSMAKLDGKSVLTVLFGVLAETVAQHAVTLALTLFALRWRGWYPNKEQPPAGTPHVDGRRVNFTPLLVPLTLLHTTLLPLVLQLFLTVWYTPPAWGTQPAPSASLVSLLPVVAHVHPEVRAFLSALDELWTGGDRVWAGTRLLGGMSAGFGLRVLLPTRPWETTAIVLAGWGAAAVAGKAVETVLSAL